MDPTDPVEWDLLVEATRVPELDCRDVFERHRDDLEAVDGMEEAVALLYEAFHEEYHEHNRVPDQGAAFIFAYLVEEADIAWLDGTPGLPPLAERKPDASTLERLFWEHERMPWWIAVRLGVHYSLVQYWLWEEDVPLMWRNLVPERREQVKTALSDDE